MLTNKLLVQQQSLAKSGTYNITTQLSSGAYVFDDSLENCSIDPSDMEGFAIAFVGTSPTDKSIQVKLRYCNRIFTLYLGIQQLGVYVQLPISGATNNVQLYRVINSQHYNTFVNYFNSANRDGKQIYLSNLRPNWDQ